MTRSRTFFFVNKGKGKFEEARLLSGVAYSDAGAPRSGMGVDAAGEEKKKTKIRKKKSKSCQPSPS